MNLYYLNSNCYDGVDYEIVDDIFGPSQVKNTRNLTSLLYLLPSLFVVCKRTMH